METRLLPVFAEIEAEATQVQEETYRKLMEGPGDPDADGSVLAELALEAGFEHFSGISGVKQGLLNLFAVSLYHTWEQQILEFHRLQVLHPSEENDVKLINLTEIRKRLTAFGVKIELLPSWPSIDELRLVANTAKHAEGKSAADLKALRPDLFEEPTTSEYALPYLRGPRRVFAPLAGDDLYVQMEHLQIWGSAIRSFWREFGDALAGA